MTGNEIFELVRTRAPQPDGLSLAELMLYTTARNIYKAYADGLISIEQAKQEKTNAIKAFGIDDLSERSWKDHARRMVMISQVLGEAEKCGCDYCKRVARIFDGRLIV